MRKYVLASLAFISLLSCKKEHSDAPVENSNQVLTRVIKTADFGGGTFSIDYAYNDAGKLIKEGDKTYERDNLQRIVRIIDAGSNKADVKVYYESKDPDKVDYTFCKLTNIDATDSIVYLHDDNGRLIKTMSYITYLSDPYVPAIASLYNYKMFSYDANGNMIQADYYNREFDGTETHSGAFFFLNYDKGINPLYTGDEVRITDLSCGSLLLNFYGVVNNSMNNCTTTTYGFGKFFEYRSDGRPKSCLVQQNGTNVFRLVYEYK